MFFQTKQCLFGAERLEMQQKRECVSETFLVMCVVYTTCLLLSNLIAGKIISIFNISLPAAVILFPITYVLCDVFTEVYGFKKAKNVIWLGFACNLVAVFVYLIAIVLPYPDFWLNQEAFSTVLGTTPRILVASFLGYLIGEFSNSIILSKLKVKMCGKKLWVRTILSTIAGQLLDSACFIFIAFFGIIKIDLLIEMMIFQYMWKLCGEIVLTPITYIVINSLKAKENIDVYDLNTKYNIFKL